MAGQALAKAEPHYNFLIPPLSGHHSRAFRPTVKCGLRWPLGKDFMAERFNIVEVWHAEYKAFKAPSMRLKLRHEDRFDYRISTGEVNNEVTLKLPGISQKLRDANLDRGSLMEMVERWDIRLMRLLLIRNSEARWLDVDLESVMMVMKGISLLHVMLFSV